LTPTAGDARCLMFGHLVRLAVWHLHSTWRDDAPVADKLEQVKSALQRIYPLDLLQTSGARHLWATLGQEAA
jgi:hypothetical protein